MAAHGKNSHERIVRGFSSIVLGAQAIFHPDDTGGKTPKEPADIAWIANRCAILFHLKESRGSFEKKIKGNLNQLRGWLRDWNGGKVLKGAAEGKQYSFTFSDIDHVVGLSIVDGGEVWCEYHPDQVIRSKDLKLAACATLTGAVLRELMATGASARDLISLISFLRDAGRRISEVDMVTMVRNRMGEVVRLMHSHFIAQGHSLAPDGTALDQVMAAASMMKHGTNDETIAEISADLTFADALWFGMAASITEAQIAKPGEYGLVQAILSLQSGIYTLRYIAGANVNEALEPVPKLLDGNPSITIAAHPLLPKVEPMRMIFVQKRRQPSIMEGEVAALRTATLGL